MRSDVKYARSGEVHIAYRIFGNGPRDLVLIPGTLSHAELYWEFPINQYLLKRLRPLLASSSSTSGVRGSPIVSASRPSDDRGRHALKRVPGDWQLFAVASA
jgi:hypothetical protein